MINGMTGFGSDELVAGKTRGLIEVKSQNHRYFDIVFYLPVGFGALEDKIRQAVNKGIKRGRVSVSLKITEKPPQSLVVNKDAVKEYLRYAKSLKKEFGLSDQLSLSELIRLPGVVESRETILSVDKMWPSIERSLKEALRGLLKMRQREGMALAKDTIKILGRMIMQIKKIESRSKTIVREKKKQLTPEEFLPFQRGSDVNEELARLKHYIDEFRLLLKSKDNAGKRLDFVAQEMQRETNTIGSKLQDKIVANAVISLKSKVEKLREQAQNIE